MANADGAPQEQAPSIEISKLSYAFPDGSTGLRDVNLSLPPSSRTLLIGGMEPFPGLLELPLLIWVKSYLQPMARGKPPCSASFPASAWPQLPLS